jgi:hypothetical protein
MCQTVWEWNLSLHYNKKITYAKMCDREKILMGETQGLNPVQYKKHNSGHKTYNWTYNLNNNKFQINTNIQFTHIQYNRAKQINNNQMESFTCEYLS